MENHRWHGRIKHKTRNHDTIMKLNVLSLHKIVVDMLKYNRFWNFLH
jgi:hypothetical protein